MLARLFHAWEHRLASVDTNRVVRPFEWGADWLPSGNKEESPEARVKQWVQTALGDTPAFFETPPTTAYHFTPTTPAKQRWGEAGTLRFPSALTTPHSENNVVSARWFPATGDTDMGRRSNRGRVVLVLPQWNANSEGHIGLARLLAHAGVSALRLSLPFHDTRMPPELTRADYIVSANVARTLQACRQAVLDARRAIAWLVDLGFERIGILGTSLGSCLAMLTSAHEPAVRAQALNHVSPFFADVTWRGLSTRHVRKGLEGHVTLDELRNFWRPISPMTYLDRVAKTRTLLVYARWDLTFPVDLSKRLVDEFRRRGLPHETAVLPCGHYTTGIIPFNLLDGYLLTRFLRQNL
jgi:dienelactone hydrolase